MSPKQRYDERKRLRIIAGETQCIDNLMGNADIAHALLNRRAEG